MKLTATEFAEIVSGEVVGAPSGNPITSVAIDSRSAHEGTAFFALRGTRSDGHRFVSEALGEGAEVAVVESSRAAELSGSIVAVEDPLRALQKLAGWWRGRFQSDVIAITGSYGKTSVKECLAHILSSFAPTYQSPGSFNSQIGVPLSILRAPLENRYSVLEVGISEPGEMRPLAEVVRPSYGIMTTIGPAHISAFGSERAIFEEKMRLFQSVQAEGWVLLPRDLEDLEERIPQLACRVYRVGTSAALPLVTGLGSACLSVQFPSGGTYEVPLGRDSVHFAANVETALTAAYLLGATAEQIIDALKTYRPVATRLETWRSSSGVTVISNTHGGDLLSIQAALDHMQAVAAPSARKFFVYEANREEPLELLDRRAVASGVDELIVVGSRDREWGVCVSSVAEARERLASKLRWGDVIVVHSGSKSGIDAVASELIGAIAPNRLYVDLQAIKENISRFKRHVGPRTRILAMVKALAYGTEVSHLAAAVQEMGVSGFGVSTPDEGIALRKAGVEGEILVMLTTPSEAEKVVEHGLTPVVYSRDILEPLARAASQAGKVIDVHLEVDTGMGRTGVFPESAVEVAQAISSSGSLRLAGVMTHFASADEEAKDAVSRTQIDAFARTNRLLEESGFTDILRHAAATSATARFPDAHFDMVRIGIGLYGVYPSEAVRHALPLVPAVSLVSRISRVQGFRKGSRIGYGGTYEVSRDDFRGAIVPIGYHDGMPWTSSNHGITLINGKEAAIVGRVSMDSMVVDVSDIPDAQQGVDVLIFGSHQGYELPVERVASLAGTMSYEMLARVGPRVQRIFLGV
jgi:alanine racemase